MEDWMYAYSDDYSDLGFDVARYLHRHFPGRCLDLGKPAPAVKGARVVYIALFAPDEAT